MDLSNLSTLTFVGSLVSAFVAMVINVVAAWTADKVRLARKKSDIKTSTNGLTTGVILTKSFPPSEEERLNYDKIRARLEEAAAIGAGASARTIPGKPVTQNRAPMTAIALLVFIALAAGTMLGAADAIAVSVRIASGETVRQVLLWAFYFSIMLLGMVGQYMWGLKNWQEFQLQEFVKPLWISVIVFVPIWSVVSTSGIAYANVAAAYQNGFFWKVILEHQTPKP